MTDNDINDAFIDNLTTADQCLLISLLRARESLIRKLLPIIRDHGLTPEQWRVIRALKLNGSMELSELSKECFLLAPSVSRIAQNLEKRELVVRKPVASDQRRSTLETTAKGDELFNQVAPEANAKQNEIKQAFSDEKCDLLFSLLNELVDSLEE